MNAKNPSTSFKVKNNISRRTTRIYLFVTSVHFVVKNMHPQTLRITQYYLTYLMVEMQHSFLKESSQ